MRGMKGIILAGGIGTRLAPLTHITNKHLLPVYNKPMILYPLETLKKSGLKEIMIVCGKEHGGHFMNFLGSGKEYGVKLSYALQDSANGIAGALSMAEDFAANSKIAVILGDNIFADNFSKSAEQFLKSEGAMVFLKKNKNPKKFGVAELKDGKIIDIEEKPKKPKSNYVTTGFYFYDNQIFDIIRALKPSKRGELEITDAHNVYIKNGLMDYAFVSGFWSDAGTIDSLLKSSIWASNRKF